MNRKQFLKRLGIGAGVAVVAPAVLANVKEEQKWTHIEDEPEFAYADSPDFISVSTNITSTIM